MTQPPPPSWQAPRAASPAPVAWSSPQPRFAPGGPARRRSNPLGAIAVALAGVALLLTVVALVVQALAIRDGATATVAGISVAFSIVRLLVVLAGVGLGIAGVLQRDRPRILAAMGLGACAAIAIGIMLGFLNFPIIALVSS